MALSRQRFLPVLLGFWSTLPGAALGSQVSSGRKVVVEIKTPTLAIGVLDGNPAQQFGDATAIAPQAGGRFALLDGRMSVLRIFDGQGGAIAELGRQGAGPGEFRVPTGVVATAGDTVAVLDHGLSRVSFFATATEKPGYRRSFQLEVPSRDFCGFGKWLFVAGFRARDTTTVRRVDLAGVESGAFGDPFPDRKDMGLSRFLSLQLRIACVAERGIVVLASDWYPAVRAYDASSGRLKWSATLRGFHQTVIEPAGEGVRFRPPDSQVVHKVTGMVALGPTLILVQLERSSRASAQAPVVRGSETRLLDVATGEELDVQHGFPRALASTGSVLYLADTTDYPRVLRVEYLVRR